MFPLLFAAAAEPSDDGAAVFGFLVICGILWAIYKACSAGPPDPPGYEFRGRATPIK